MTGTWFCGDRECHTLPVDDRGLHYGDGLFETIAIRDGRPRLWSLHVDRLQSSGDRLSIEIPAPDQLRANLDNAIGSSGKTARATAKIIVTRGSGRRGYRYAENSSPRTIIGIFDTPIEPSENWERGVVVRLCTLRLASQPALAGMKTLNRLEQVLARSEWQDASIAEGLMMDADGNVVCGTMCNVFFVDGARVITPAITVSGVCGVMRRHIIEIMHRAKFSIAVEPVTTAEMRECREIFLCNSQIGVWPVRECAGSRYSAPGPMTQRIMELLAHSGIVECRQ
ncbi:MAG: aminodeoxychorismate lyase [Gammaproteobacteria bacterium]|nr:aminodeoxychorismate lyase [Gammaproteobacteria bacterium]MDH4314776.1 aminodeoxychorismate lyase [Gammaproteobacteria bacterium]MDH5502100.1 aminodeoxychorismate lyase [Gammaproteobacteria bacterium]